MSLIRIILFYFGCLTRRERYEDLILVSHYPFNERVNN